MSQKLYITDDTIVKYFPFKNKSVKRGIKEIQEFAQYSYGKNLALYQIFLLENSDNKEIRVT